MNDKDRELTFWQSTFLSALRGIAIYFVLTLMGEPAFNIHFTTFQIITIGILISL